jgi:hypothetical protein
MQATTSDQAAQFIPTAGSHRIGVSHHLSRLRRAVIVESEQRGMTVYHGPQRDALVALRSVLDPCCRS